MEARVRRVGGFGGRHGLECVARGGHKSLRGRYRGRRPGVGGLFGEGAGCVDGLHQSRRHDPACRRSAHSRRPDALRRPGVFNRAGNLAGARRQFRRQPHRLVPRRRHVLRAQRVAGHQGGGRRHRQLRIGGEIRRGLGRPVPRAGRNAARRVDPSLGRVARQRESLAGSEPQRDVRQARECGGRQQCHRSGRQPYTRRQRVGHWRQHRLAV